MAPSNLNHLKTDPEYIKLLKFLIEKTENVASPISIQGVAREFKEKSGVAISVPGLIQRIERIRTTIHSFDHIDTETKVKILFALSAPITANFMEELEKDAVVEIDDNKRIVHYKSNDGNLELKGDHSLSAKVKTGKSESKGSLRSLIISHFENKNNADAIPKNKKEKDMGNLIEFITEKCQNVSSPLNIRKLVKTFEKRIGIKRSDQKIRMRIKGYCREIQKLEFLDNHSKVKQLFGLSATVDSNFLEKLRKVAVVEVDQKNRITKYTANDGSLTLRGSHWGFKNTEARRGSDDDSDENSSEEFDSELKSDEENDPQDETEDLTQSLNQASEFDNDTPVRNRSPNNMSIDDNFDFDPPTERSHRSEVIETREDEEKEDDPKITRNAGIKTRYGRLSKRRRYPDSEDDNDNDDLDKPENAMEPSSEANDSDNETPVRNRSPTNMSIDDNFDFDPPTERSHRSEETEMREDEEMNDSGITENTAVMTRSISIETLPKSKTSSSTSHTPKTSKRKAIPSGSNASKRTKPYSDEYLNPLKGNDPEITVNKEIKTRYGRLSKRRYPDPEDDSDSENENDGSDKPEKAVEPSSEAHDSDNETPVRNRSPTEMSFDDNFEFDPPTERSHRSEETEMREDKETLPKNKTTSSTSHTPRTPKRKAASSGSSSTKRTKPSLEKSMNSGEMEDNFSQDDPSAVGLPYGIEDDSDIQQIPKPRPQVMETPIKKDKMTPSFSNNWTTDPEYIKLLNYFIEKTKDVESPINVKQVVREFKEKSRAPQTVNCLYIRIHNVRTMIHSFEHIDINTRVKMIFVMSVPVDPDFLKELKKNAIVEVDGKNRISHYKAIDGSLHLNGDHSHSTKIKTVKVESKDGENDHLDNTEDLMGPSTVDFDNETPLRTRSPTNMSIDDNFDFDPPTERSHRSEEIEMRGDDSEITGEAAVKTRKLETLPKSKTSSSTSHTPEPSKRKAVLSGSNTIKRTKPPLEKTMNPIKINDNVSHDDPSRIELEPLREPLGNPEEIEEDPDIQQIPNPRTQAPIEENHGKEGHISLKMVLKAFKSLILSLDAPGLSQFQMEIDKKIMETGRRIEVSNKEVILAMKFLIIKSSNHGALGSSEDSISLRDIFLMLRTILLNSSFNGLELILEMLKENIEKLKVLDKKVPVTKVECVLRVTLNNICT